MSDQESKKNNDSVENSDASKSLDANPTDANVEEHTEEHKEEATLSDVDANTSVETTATISKMPEELLEEAKPEQKKAKTGALWFFVIINFLLIIGVVAAAVYFYYQWQKTVGTENNEVVVLQTEVSNANSDIAKVNAQIKKLENQLQSTGSALKPQVSSILSEHGATLDSELANLTTLANTNADDAATLKRKVSELSGRRPADWLLAEADYLVRMAGRKLYLEKDVGTAMLMLQSADARLADLADPSLFPVRKLIAKDIQSLHQVNPVSTNSVALAINGMVIQVDQLPLKAMEIPEFEESEAAKRLSNDVADWQENLSKTWDAIVDDFIQVESSNEPILPYLSTKQRWLITEQLKLALAQAQSAAINEREVLYQASIQQAMAIVVEHYLLDDTKVKQYLEALQQLSNTEVTKDYPRELDSTRALKDLLDERVTGAFGNDLLDDSVQSQQQAEQDPQEPQNDEDEGAL